jgi:hypothetical protein
MKKLLLLAFIAAHGLIAAQSDSEASLIMRYKPQTAYQISTNSAVDINMTYVGSEEVLQILKDKGVENPTVKSETTQNEMLISTGKLSKKNDFQVALRFISSNNSALNNFVKSHAVVHGRCTTESFPVFDSISNTKISNEFKEIFLNAIQSILSQVKYPEQSIKVGETASLDTPFILPMGPVTVNMNINTTYKLVGVKNGMANYDIDIVFTLTSTIKEYNILGGGGGSGTMIFDLTNNYYKSYTTNIDMDLSVDMGEAAIHLKMTQKVDAAATLKKIKE